MKNSQMLEIYPDCIPGFVVYPTSPHTYIKVEGRIMLETVKYRRKQFSIDAVQITDKNMAEVAGWVEGTILTDDQKKMYVQVDVKNPLNPRQSMAYVTDWVLLSGNGFKVYTNKAFRSSFEQVSVETTLHSVTPRPYVEPTPEVVEVVEKVTTTTTPVPAADSETRGIPPVPISLDRATLAEPPAGTGG